MLSPQLQILLMFIQMTNNFAFIVSFGRMLAICAFVPSCSWHMTLLVLTVICLDLAKLTKSSLYVDESFNYSKFQNLYIVQVYQAQAIHSSKCCMSRKNYQREKTHSNIKL